MRGPFDRTDEPEVDISGLLVSRQLATAIPPLAMRRGWDFYLAERVARLHQDEYQVGLHAKFACAFFGDDRDINTLKLEDFAKFTEWIMSDGRTASTAAKHLTLIHAMAAHNFRRGRLMRVPPMEKPQVQHAKRRPLTPDEFRLVMSKPMSGRLRRLYRTMYFTGARSRAVEEWRWSWGVNFEAGVLNFNVPGRRRHNKRRVDGFPIPDGFLPHLRAWRERATDDYVIGLGPSGRATSTYHAADHHVRVVCGLKDPALVPRHCMRKMFVTELAHEMIRRTGQADLETIGALVGDNPDMLRKAEYLKLKDDHLRAAANLQR